MYEEWEGTLQESLTARELEILRLMGRGLSNREIGQRLYISTETVKWYNKRIYTKLNVRSRTQAVARARKLGVHQAPASPAAATPTGPAAPRHHNLPAPLTSFVSRERDVAAIRSLLQANRLLTLTGPGGTGKTRLALKVATDLVTDYSDGVTIVGLAPLDDPALVMESVADALGIIEQPGERLLLSLQRFLANKQLLLLLDNFEHVLSGAPPLIDLLSAAPQLSILVTSREPLRLGGEQQYPVAPLELPSAQVEPLAAAQAPAVQLFRERARAVRPSFEVNEHNVRTVVRICALLDGLPLAIELAAARSNFFSPGALLARLQQRGDAPALQLLSDGARDLSARQQTLRATIDWSYHLLIAEEQELFRRLAVFASGCTLEAVEVVSGLADEGADDIIDLLSSLVDKNLLRSADGPDGQPRLRMLHTIREYARERLERLGEEQQVGGRHARYYLGLAETAAAELRGSEQARWLSRLEAERDNLRAALEWCARNNKPEDFAGLASTLWLFWILRGPLSEGRYWLEKAVREHQDVSLNTRIAVLVGASEIARFQGDFAAAIDWKRECLDHADKMEKTAICAATLHDLAIMLADSGDLDQALGYAEQALSLRRELDAPFGIAHALGAVAFVRTSHGDLAEAKAAAMEQEAIARHLENDDMLSRALDSLLHIAVREGRIVESYRLAEAVVKLHQKLGDIHSFVSDLVPIACLAASQGRAAATARLMGATSRLTQTHGFYLELPDRAWIEQTVSSMRLKLGEDAWTHEFDAGERLAEDLLDPALREGQHLELNVLLDAVDVKVEPAVYPAGLTRREVDVLRLVAQGMTDFQVAAALVISPRTVNAHLTSIYSKLGVSSRTAASRLAHESGLL